AALLAVGEEGERRRLVAVRLLEGMRLDDAEHRPHGVGYGASLREVLVAEQHRDAIVLLGVRSMLDLMQLGVGLARLIERRVEARTYLAGAKEGEQRRVVDIVEGRVGLC